MDGISIFGLNGSGESTLAHALAKQTGYFEMDVEDYYFPKQRKSRKWYLDNNGMVDTEPLDELPYSNPKTKVEVQIALIEDMQAHSRFILSCVKMNWDNAILSRIDLAFWIQTPLEERLKRIQAREERRFGERVLPGGDMYMQQMEFRKAVKSRDSKAVEESAKGLNCPIVVLDGTLPVQENVRNILRYLNL